MRRRFKTWFTWQRSASYSTGDDASDNEEPEEGGKKLEKSQSFVRDTTRASFADRMKGIRKDVKKKISKLKTSKNGLEIDGNRLEVPEEEGISADGMHCGSSPQPSTSSGSARSSTSVEEEQPLYTGPFVGKCRVHTDYTPSPYDRDALILKRGDIIDIIQMTPTGMWKGVLHKKMGTFKFINVDIIPEETPRTVRRKKQHTKRLSKKTKPKTVEELLKRLGLQHLVTVFLLHGYDKLEVFSELEEVDLDELHILDPEERAKILTAAALLLDYETPESPEPCCKNGTTSSTPTDTTGSSQSPVTVSSCDSPHSPRHPMSSPRDSGCYASNENLLNKDGSQRSPGSTSSRDSSQTASTTKDHRGDLDTGSSSGRSKTDTDSAVSSSPTEKQTDTDQSASERQSEETVIPQGTPPQAGSSGAALNNNLCSGSGNNNNNNTNHQTSEMETSSSADSVKSVIKDIVCTLSAEGMQVERTHTSSYHSEGSEYTQEDREVFAITNGTNIIAPQKTVVEVTKEETASKEPIPSSSPSQKAKAVSNSLKETEVLENGHISNSSSVSSMSSDGTPVSSKTSVVAKNKEQVLPSGASPRDNGSGSSEGKSTDGASNGVAEASPRRRNRPKPLPPKRTTSQLSTPVTSPVTSPRTGGQVKKPPPVPKRHGRSESQGSPAPGSPQGVPSSPKCMSPSLRDASTQSMKQEVVLTSSQRNASTQSSGRGESHGSGKMEATTKSSPMQAVKHHHGKALHSPTHKQLASFRAGGGGGGSSQAVQKPMHRQTSLISKRRPRPISATLESVVVAKLEDEMIDLTQLPYTDKHGFCGIPPTLVLRYTEELRRDLHEVAEALDMIRMKSLHTTARPGVPNDFLADSCLSPVLYETNTSSVPDFLASIGLPMYLELLVHHGYKNIDSVKDMREVDFRHCGVNDPRHIKRLLGAVDMLRHQVEKPSHSRSSGKVSAIMDKV